MLEVYRELRRVLPGDARHHRREARGRALPGRRDEPLDRGDDAGRQGAAGRHLALPRARASPRRPRSSFLDRDGERQLVHTSSWGVSTRLLGALIMSHSDDVGLRLPPTVAPAAGRRRADPARRGRRRGARRGRGAGGRDRRADLRRASRCACWPTCATAKRRRSAGSGSRRACRWSSKSARATSTEGVVAMRRRDDRGRSGGERRRGARSAPASADPRARSRRGYFEPAAERLERRGRHGTIDDLDDFRRVVRGRRRRMPRAGGFVRAPWSEAAESAAILEELKVSVRCIPFDQQLAPGSACVLTGKPAVVEAVFGKAY